MRLKFEEDGTPYVAMVGGHRKESISRENNAWFYSRWDRWQKSYLRWGHSAHCNTRRRTTGRDTARFLKQAQALVAWV